ncbi:transposase [Streptomyces sp. NPDC018352]|uniref:transposase n=1 Tax=Streptomyces sp. NPDC018352 TaxID=3157194 RepID=UPI0033D31C3D
MLRGGAGIVGLTKLSRSIAGSPHGLRYCFGGMTDAAQVPFINPDSDYPCCWFCPALRLPRTGFLVVDRPSRHWPFDAADGYRYSVDGRIPVCVSPGRSDWNLSGQLLHRAYNRMRDTLTGVFPALERAFNFSAHKGAVVLLTGFQTLAALRRMGHSRLTAWLAKRGVRLPHGVEELAIEAAKAQQTSLPGEDAAAQIIEDLANSILNLTERIARVEKQMEKMLNEHPQEPILLSMPGMGHILAAELLVAAGDFSAYATEGHFASAAGMVPVSRGSGTRTGINVRPKRYSRPLQRALFLAAQAACFHHQRDRDYYSRKRAQGMRHSAAVICVARRQIRMLWTLLREDRQYQIDPPERGTDA